MLALPPGGPRTLALLAFFSAPALGAGQPPAPPPSPVPPGEAVVVAAVENLYSSPSTDSDVVSQAFVGQSVALLEERGGFARVETPDRYAGWIPRGALRAYPDADTPRYATRGRVAEVESLLANVYRETDVTSARPKLVAPFTARLEVLDEGGEARWLRVRLPSGETGFVQSGDVRVAEAGAARPPLAGPELVAVARRFVGLPYLWGGMTPWGLDCSGFVSAVYRASGRLLPRDADQQWGDPGAQPVERAALEPGDLVFFGGESIGHVGLYAGDGRFLHATTHERPVVQESRLDEPHWTEIYRGARRPR